MIKPSYIGISTEDPLKTIRIAILLMLSCAVIGFGLPYLAAKETGVLDDGSLRTKMLVKANENLTAGNGKKADTILKRVVYDCIFFEAKTDSIKHKLAEIESYLINSESESLVTANISQLLTLKQQLLVEMKDRKPPYRISGFLTSSTVVLWPILLTGLSWILYLFSPKNPVARNRKLTIKKTVVVFGTIYLLYRVPIIRNFFFLDTGRIFYGHANVDIDFPRFIVQEVLGSLVTFLLARIWVNWSDVYTNYRKGVS